MNLDDFVTDKAKEENGVWMDMGGGAESLIARWGNPKMSKALQKFSNSHRAQIKAGTLPDSYNEQRMAEIMADTVFLAFRGDWTQKGKPISDSRKTRIEMLKLRDFLELIAGMSQEQAAYKADADAEAVGN